MSLPPRSFELVSTNVGRGTVLGEVAKRPVRSGIHKIPVTASAIEIGRQGLMRDGQVDTRVKDGKQIHGGPDKAVYMYPSEHLALWSAELGRPIGYGGFGENLSTRGVTEADIYIGDMLQIGNVRLVVTKPRRPCFKLNLYYERDDMVQLMEANLRCGWYCRVLQDGYMMPTTGTILVVGREPDAISVQQAFINKLAQRGR